MSIQLIADQLNKKFILQDTSTKKTIISKVLHDRPEPDLTGLITDFSDSELNEMANVKANDRVQFIFTKPA